MTSELFIGLCGIDVCKSSLDICVDGQKKTRRIANNLTAIEQWLDELTPGVWALAVEPTNSFHRTFVSAAHQRGHTVFLVDALRLNRYRQSMGVRAKTDTLDPPLLHRYISREMQDLRPWEPLPEAVSQLRQLMKARAAIVKDRSRIKQSLRAIDTALVDEKPLMDAFNQLLKETDQAITKCIAEQGWQDDYQRCQKIEGVGPITAAVVMTAYHRGHFTRVDSFVAFLGMDVRVRESGKYAGRRKLTKQGDSEARRVLYCAAMAARRSTTWAPWYQRCLERGLTDIQALVALARKLLRVMFGLLKTQTDYDPSKSLIAT